MNATIKMLNETIEKQNKIIEEQQKKEILRLKSKNDKDSSNSSRPSNTDGFKKVITNRREKSNKNETEITFNRKNSNGIMQKKDNIEQLV